MVNFADRLAGAIREKKSSVCVGLDPRIDKLPKPFLKGAKKDLEGAGRAVLEFNAQVLSIVRPHAAVVKPQIAFYEKLGPYGMLAYLATLQNARDQSLLVIGDVKRGDVTGTAAAYADAHAVAFPADAVTVNPYLGSDGIDPFVEAAKQHSTGMFILVKTSNPRSGEFQDLVADGKPLYLHVAEKVGEWGKDLVGKAGYSSVGAVVGATHPEQAAKIRAALPRAFFLVPGYGAQGATSADLKGCFNDDGLGAVVNSSRGITAAWERDPYRDLPWEKAVERAVIDMKDDLNGALGA